MPNLNQPGSYTLKTFKLWSYDLEYSIDLKMLMHRFEITESMSNGSIRGSALIVDSNGILDTFANNQGIDGQELLEVVYEDYYGLARQELYAVYAVDNINYGDEKNPGFLAYTIYFTSPHKFFSENHRVQRAYTGEKISTYVKDLYGEYMREKIPTQILSKFPFADKLLTVEDTSNGRNIVVPKMNPEGSMHLFSRNAWTDLNPLGNGKESSQTFRFFEARDKFYFATIEYMRSLTQSPLVMGTGSKLEPERGILKFYRNYYASVSPEAGAASMNYIINVDFGTKVNTIDYLVSGAYKRRTFEFDLATMNVNDYTYDYTEQINDKTLAPKHSKDFIKDHMSKEKEIFVFNAVDNAGNDMRYQELYTTKPMYFMNQNNNLINVVIYGRNDLFAGSTVDITFLTHTNAMVGKPTIDEERSGEYFVEKAQSIFDGNVYTQALALTRGGVTK